MRCVRDRDLSIRVSQASDDGVVGIAEELRAQYFMAYSTDNEEWDGRWIKIRVEPVDRPMKVRMPQTGHFGTVTGLVEATLASLPSDLGAPWVDTEGRLVALQMATGLARSVPEDLRQAEVQGLILRPRPTASRAVRPAS